MLIQISKDIRIINDGFVFKLEYYDKEYFFKTFDLLLNKLVNLDLCSKGLDDVRSMLREIEGLKGLINELYTVYGHDLNKQSCDNIGALC